MFLRIEKGDLGEDGAEPNRILELTRGVLALVLHSSFEFGRSILLLSLSTFLPPNVLQRRRGVEGLLLLAIELDSLSASATAAAAAAAVLLSLGRVLQNAFLQPLPIF